MIPSISENKFNKDETTFVHEVKQCRECNFSFIYVSWLQHRVDGFCSKKCIEKFEERKNNH